MTKKTAIEYLQKFYSNTPTDVVNLSEIYTAYNFDLTDKKRNRVWLGNKLIYMKRLGLVVPVYRENKLASLRLTDEGKRALGRLNGNSTKTVSETNGKRNGIIALEDIMKEIPRLRQENPDFEITFDVRLRNV